MDEKAIIGSIDILVILIYLLAVLAIGFFASRKIKSSADYATASRSFGLPVLSGTLIGSTIGAAATMGKAGKAVEAGYAVLYASLAYFLGYIILAFLAPQLRRASIDSMPDVLQRRFGPGMRIMAAVVVLAVVIPTIGIQFMASAIIVTNFMPGFGLTYSEIVIIAAAVIVLYTLLGGLFAVAYTDLFQVVIMLIGIGLILPIVLVTNFGSLGAVNEVLTSPTHGWTGGMDMGYIISFIPIFTAFVLIDPGAWQRIAAAKRAEDLKPAMLITAGFYGFWSVLVVGLGVVVYNSYPEFAVPDSAIPQLIIDYMPPVIKGICLAAIIALIMSTADTALLIAGTTVSWDVVRVLRPNTADKKLLLISRGSILVVGVLGVFFALTRIPLFEVNLLALGLLVSGLFIPVMGALFYKKVTGIAAVLASIVGMGTILALFVLQYGTGYNPPIQPIIAGLMASFMTIILISHLTWSPERASDPILDQANIGGAL